MTAIVLHCPINSGTNAIIQTWYDKLVLSGYKDPLVLDTGDGYSIQFGFEEHQSEITGALIDEMFKAPPEQLSIKTTNMQYGPVKKRGKGKVKKWV